MREAPIPEGKDVALESHPSTASSAAPALARRGELTRLVESLDWSKTPLGPREQWPQSLRSVVNIVLTSRYAMWMGWGPKLTFLYNDAYRPTLGIKHPWALGSSTMRVWAEIWKDIGPRVESVLASGEATYDEGLMLLLERSGFPEETYHTFSYSPLADESGQVNGMLCVVTEETERVISERRLATLSNVASSVAAAATEIEAVAAMGAPLRSNPKDLPFALVYLFDDQGRARLAGMTGFEDGGPEMQNAAAPPVIAATSDEPWPARRMLQRPAMALMDLAALNQSISLPTGAWDRPPAQAAIVPIKQQASDRPAGFLVLGLNPYRLYDAPYASFVELIAGQLASVIASARTYEQERRRAEALAELDRAKTTFFSNVSHEFRTPLTLILGPLDELLGKADSELPSGGRELLTAVQRSGLRLQRLVNTLLDFSRIEAGRTRAVYEPTDLSAFTAELASSFQSAMERAGLRFVIRCEPLSRPVYVDREMWEKVVLNLLSNAFKYTLEGSVSVVLRERGNSVQLSVEDTGGGIPEAELPRLFERFHRVEGARGRTHEGTGIGLALVQELVKLHGGSVLAASTFGQGSTFTVTLPFGSAHLPQDRLGLARSLNAAAAYTGGFAAGAFVEEALHWLPPGAASADHEPAEPAQPRHGPRSVVLLADDNADMREYVRRLLSERYDVVAVSDGEQALATALSHPPDLVLTDIMMPVLDGFGLLRELRANELTKTLPILLLSARAGEESRVEGLDAGADDYLVKPFAARELLARVEAHLSLARMRREADEARRLTEARLGLALQASKMVAWEWNPATDQVMATGDLKSVFGTSVESSRDAWPLVVPEDEPRHRQTVDRVAREGGSYLSEYRIRRADNGQITWVEDRATGIADESGHISRVIGVLTDITGRKAAEEEVRRRNAELERANGELEEFAYVASHDLQEPLRMVSIYADLLLERAGPKNDPEAEQFAGFVRKGVVQMETLIKDLLSYSRVVHPDQEEARAANLNGSLDHALSILQLSMEEAGAILVRHPLPVVRGEERELALVFQNLLANALKYRKKDVQLHVEIGSEARGGEWVVTVRDNGIGFAPQHATRIFGLFKRLHKDAYPGTGLGLAIAKRIVERYGGRIWADSAGDGLGAQFSFSLPQARGVPQAAS